jgi:competence protein comEA helix-hairpin-helix repeat region
MASSAVRLFDFDPNTLDSGGFVALGLKPFVAKNIVNYRNKGGRFRRADDFARVYGLLPADFARLKPYIHIADTKENKSDLQATQTIDKQAENASRKVENNIVVELNTADTAALRQLHGIGSYYARQIVYYRDKLGGYYSVDQLLEIKNFPVQTFERIKNNLTVDPALIKKINVNWATVEKLNRHPYLNFYQSKAIFELRKKQKLQSIDDFRQISDFSDEDLKKLENYLLFK